MTIKNKMDLKFYEINMKKILFISFFILLSTNAFGQQNLSPKLPEVLNIDFMLPSYFKAGSKIVDQGRFGFFKSKNFPKPIVSNMNVPKSVITLIAKPEEETVFAKKYKGIKLLLVNATNEQVGFAAVDSRLYIVQEALDQDGKWKPIETLPGSVCGNSRHTVFLGANEYWEFAAALYTGKIQTKMRFRLDNLKSKTEQLPIYSNEFDGSVNAKQFTVGRGVLSQAN